MTEIKYRLTACSDPAGKKNDIAPLYGNEDNMLLLPGLSPEPFVPDAVLELGPHGTLLMVADGMGGMNAGEVASQIAVSTAQAMFCSEEAQSLDASSYQAREAFMEKVVVQADTAIKEKAAADPECSGMGSTIIMIWLCGNEATVTWCGDSRAYLFRPSIGLRQVSKDHSYVQSLVDAGKITADEAFGHPYGNVITRSLGDPSKAAKADSHTFPIYKGDILMLNSDGLSGVLRDKTMQDIIADSRQTPTQCREALWKAAQEADWYDNVTCILCELVEGPEAPAVVPAPAPAPQPAPQPAPAPAPQPAPAPSRPAAPPVKPAPKGGKNKMVIVISVVISIVVATVLALLLMGGGKGTTEPGPAPTEVQGNKPPKPQAANSGNQANKPPKPSQGASQGSSQPSTQPATASQPPQGGSSAADQGGKIDQANENNKPDAADENKPNSGSGNKPNNSSEGKPSNNQSGQNNQTGQGNNQTNIEITENYEN